MTKRTGFFLLIGMIYAFPGFQTAQAAPDDGTVTPEKTAQGLLDRMSSGGSITAEEKTWLDGYAQLDPGFWDRSQENPLDNSGGGDGFGYAFVDNVAPDTAAFSWIELCDSTGTTAGPTGDDAVSAAIPIGFSFPFYGASYTSCYLATNGVVSFGTAYGGSGQYQALDPTTNNPTSAFIAVNWGDQNGITTGGCANAGADWIRCKSIGISPNQYFVAEWRRMPEFGSTGNSWSYEAIIYPNGQIKVQFHTDAYSPPTYTARTWAVGIDAPGAANGVRYWYYNTAGPVETGIRPGSGRAIWFFQPVFTNDFQPIALLSPSGSQVPNAVVNVTARIKNRGTAANSAPVRYTFNGGPIISETTGLLNQDETEDHTFTTQITMPAVNGSYPLTVYTDLATDEFRGNDTLNVNVLVFTGGSCSSAIELAGFGPDSALYNNCGAGDNDPGQPCGASGQDMVFKIDVPDGYQAVLWQTSNAIDSRHSLRWGGACPGDNFIDCQDSPDEKKMRFVNQTGSTQTAYLVVGGWSTSTLCGDFRVAWQLTSCGPAAAPFTTSFEDSTAPVFPTCFGIAQAFPPAATTSPLWEAYTTSPRTGTRSASVLGATVGNDDWLFSRGVSLTGGTAYTVDFWWAGASATVPESLEVKAGTTNTPAGMTLDVMTMQQLLSTTYAERSPTFTPASSGTYYIGWHNVSKRSACRTRIDDVSIFEGTCLAPTVTLPNAFGFSQATLTATVTGGAGGTPTYQWYTGAGCTPGNEIGGAIGLTYNATSAGTYSFSATIATCATCASASATLGVGDDCSSPLVLSSPGPDSLLYSNSGANSDNPGQPCWPSGQDVVFEVSVADGEQVVVWESANNNILGRHTLRWGGSCPGDFFVDGASTESRRMRFVNNTGSAQTAWVTVGITTSPGTPGNLGVGWQRTACTPNTVPFFAGFETGAATPILPDCWGMANDVCDVTTEHMWENYSTSSRTGTRNASILGNATGNDDWLFSPGLSLTGSQVYTLDFWWRGASTSVPESLEVYAGTGNTPGDMAINVMPMDTIKRTVYMNRISQFTAPTTGTYYIGWHNVTQQSAGRTYIDDINVFQGDCVPPTVNANAASGYGSVVLTATSTGGAGGPPAYQWYTGLDCLPGNAITDSTGLTLTVTTFGTNIYSFSSTINSCVVCDSALATVLPPLPGTDCSNAVELPGLTGTLTMSNCDHVDNTPGSTCDGSPQFWESDVVFHRLIQDGDSIRIFQSSNTFDSRHQLRWGGACPGANEVDCIDDPDTDPMAWMNTSGTEQDVWVLVGGWTSGTACGDFTLNWEIVPGCVPDTVADLTVYRAPGLSTDVILYWTGDPAFPGTYSLYYNTVYDPAFPGTWTSLQTGMAPAVSMSYTDVAGLSSRKFYLVISECSALASTPASVVPDPMTKSEAEAK